jgi:DNA processing protein
MGLSAEEKVIFIHENRSPLAIDDLTIKANTPMSQLAMNLLNTQTQRFIAPYQERPIL